MEEGTLFPMCDAIITWEGTEGHDPLVLNDAQDLERGESKLEGRNARTGR